MASIVRGRGRELAADLRSQAVSPPSEVDNEGRVVAQAGGDPLAARAYADVGQQRQAVLGHKDVIDVVGGPVCRAGAPVEGWMLFGAVLQSQKSVIRADEAQVSARGDRVGVVPLLARPIPAEVIVQVAGD